jgi:hypothetical protein
MAGAVFRLLIPTPPSSPAQPKHHFAMLKMHPTGIEILPMEANANLNVALQRILDIISYVHAGLSSVTEANFRENPSARTFHPAGNSQLSFSEAKAEAERWLLRGMITEAVDLTGAFLEEIFCLGLLVETCPETGRFDFAEFERAKGLELPKFHKLGFPQKLETLRARYGIASIYEKHFLTLNRLRNCMVHRGGLVSSHDENENNKLRVTFRSQTLYAKSQSTGREYPIRFQTPVIPPEAGDAGPAALWVQWQDSELTFENGEKVSLTFAELSACTQTIWIFSRELCVSFANYVQNRGVPTKPPSATSN